MKVEVGGVFFFFWGGRPPIQLMVSCWFGFLESSKMKEIGILGCTPGLTRAVSWNETSLGGLGDRKSTDG